MHRKSSTIYIVCLIAKQIEKLRLQHRNHKVEGCICIGHNQKQGCFPVTDLIQFHFIIKRLMQRTGLTVADIDLWEINEAFAVVAMAAMRDLDLDHDRVNVNGGACALGHPIGASGARVMVTLLNALEINGLSRGVASLCIGGGEATAIAIERLN